MFFEENLTVLTRKNEKLPLAFLRPVPYTDYVVVESGGK